MKTPDLTPKFEHAALEQDIARLSAEIKSRPEARPEAAREVLKEAVGREIYPEKAAAPAKEKVGEPASPILPAYLTTSGEEVKLKVEKLIDLAWHKGIAAAVKEAKKSGSLVLDALHDALTDKLYEEFKKRGLLK